MKFIFTPIDISEELQHKHLHKLDSKAFENVKNILHQIDDSYELKTVNLGVGADWVSILVNY